MKVKQLKAPRLRFYSKPIEQMHTSALLASQYLDEAYRLYGCDKIQHVGVTFWLLLSELENKEAT